MCSWLLECERGFGSEASSVESNKSNLMGDDWGGGGGGKRGRLDVTLFTLKILTNGFRLALELKICFQAAGGN